MTLGYFFVRADNFKLGLLLNSIDIVGSLDSVLIGWMGGIHPDIGWLTIGLRLASFAEGVALGRILSNLRRDLC